MVKRDDANRLAALAREAISRARTSNDDGAARQVTADAVLEALRASSDVYSPFPFWSGGTLIVQGWVKDADAMRTVTRLIAEIAPALRFENRLAIGLPSDATDPAFIMPALSPAELDELEKVADEFSRSIHRITMLRKPGAGTEVLEADLAIARDRWDELPRGYQAAALGRLTTECQAIARDLGFVLPEPGE